MWDWSTFFHYLHSPYLIKGAGISLGLSIGAMVIGLVCGLVAALMRMSHNPLIRQPASFYVWLFRGTPVLVQLIIIYTGLPQLGIKLSVLSSALLGLGVNEGAYLAEIIRAGISAVPRGQFEAARADRHDPDHHDARGGHAAGTADHHSRRLGNAFNGLMKTSSLASVISMEELLRRTELLIQVQFKVLEIFVDAAICLPAADDAMGFRAAAAGGAFLALGDRIQQIAPAGRRGEDTGAEPTRWCRMTPPDTTPQWMVEAQGHPQIFRQQSRVCAAST